MDVTTDTTPASSGTTSNQNDFFDISCNWQVNNERSMQGTITSTLLQQEPERTNMEDVVSLDTCIALKPTSKGQEPCVIHIKLKNLQKIARIAVVSEASVLEFFKQYGEYKGTVFAEFIDEFQGNSVFFAETKIDPPTVEASIKFAKLKTEGPLMWIYGIRLILTEPSKESETSMFNHEIIKNFLVNSNGSMHNRHEMAEKLMQAFDNERKQIMNGEDLWQKSFMALSLNATNKMQCTEEDDREDIKNQNTQLKSDTDIKTYIDNEFRNMESRLIQKMSEVEYRINEKLDTILKAVETSLNRN